MSGDQQLICSDCQAPFTFTEGEQEFFADKGLKPPRRCKECRAAKKANGGYVLPSQRIQKRIPGAGAHSPNNRVNVGMGSDDQDTI